MSEGSKAPVGETPRPSRLRAAAGFVRRFAVLLLLVAASVAGGVAWQLQASASADLKRAQAVQQDDVEGEPAPPPRVSDYRAILATLDRSLRIRQRIDSDLGRIEKAVAGLQSQQDKAAAISAAGGAEIGKIAGTLGSAAGAARSVSSALETLEGRIDRSETLTRAIAEELEELDQSFGPTLDEDLLDRIEDILPGGSR